MERHIFDQNQPQGSMSLMNLRNTLRALFQGDFMPLRARASMVLDDMEYSSDSAAQAVWSGTGITISKTTTKYEGNYALQAVIDATGNRTLSRSHTLDLSAFKYAKVWERCSATSSAIQFYLKDSSGNESYWDITTNGSADTWQQDSLDLSSPDSNNGTNATLSSITEWGFRGLDASATYIFDTVKTTCGLNVAIEGTNIGSFYKQVYVGSQPLEITAKSSGSITPPSTNPRIDILCVDSSGNLSWVTGTEASSPSPDWSSVDSSKMPVCLVYCKTTMAKVVDYEDKDSNPNEGYIYADVRPLLRLGVMTFLGLTDTPSSYSGQGGKALMVKENEEGIEFEQATEFRSGDMMLSANESTPDGWTDISSTYYNKFIRISSGTPLATGGSDTHDHGGATGSHALTSGEIPSHSHTLGVGGNGAGDYGGPYPGVADVYPGPGYSATTSAVGGGSGHTHTIASTNNVPAYILARLYKKN